MTGIAIAMMAVTLAGALLAVSLRNVLHAIFGLAIALIGLAGLFLVLSSPFVAAMEVLIYVGGISVAMVFAVMLSSSLNDGEAPGSGESRARKLLAVFPAAALLGVLLLVFVDTGFNQGGPPLGAELDPAWMEASSVPAIGRQLLTKYNLVFEALSVVLLLAIVGSVAIARRDKPKAAPGQTSGVPATAADTATGEGA